MNESDWKLLGNKDLSTCEIGQAVARIVTAVRERLRLDSPTQNPLNIPLLSPKRKLGRSRSTLSKMKTFVFQRPSLNEEEEDVEERPVL